ncbi:hypothetical protein EVAR_101890_1 [Eumeta japonica]|uniref:Uncharacterized protein n=1 Tax=Eumeta variegata TaxID=151549 RepID=A0A4C1SQT4_EUMVA|nr:hypothetical protein EVAR_101890_1 [Eumeta japonica]
MYRNKAEIKTEYRVHDKSDDERMVQALLPIRRFPVTALVIAVVSSLQLVSGLYGTSATCNVYWASMEEDCGSRVGCVRPLSLFYSDVSADGLEERSLVPRSLSHAQLRRNATMSHAFSCVQPAFIDL